MNRGVRQASTALQEFAAVTRSIIRRNGLAHFLPVPAFPARREVPVPEGLPTEVDPESAALRWAARLARPGEEYLVAFEIGATHFTVVRRIGRKQEEASSKAEAA